MLQGAVRAAAGLGLIYSGNLGIKATWSLGKIGVQSERVEASFDKLAAPIGEAGGAMLEDMNEAADETNFPNFMLRHRSIRRPGSVQDAL